MQRADDAEEVVRARLAEYTEETGGVTRLFGPQVVSIKGSPSADAEQNENEMLAQVKAALG